MSRMKSEGPASVGTWVSAGLFSVIIKCRTESNRDQRQCPILASASLSDIGVCWRDCLRSFGHTSAERRHCLATWRKRTLSKLIRILYFNERFVAPDDPG